MFDPNKVRMLALVGMTIAAGACESSTGPATLDDFDAQAALEDYQAVDGILSSPGWAGFQSLGDRAPLAGLGSSATSAMGMVSSATRLAADGDARGFAVEIARAVAAVDGPATAPIISEQNRGMTFVYDPEVGEYVADPTRAGAPATGVRFILYDESSGQPDPEQEIGHADLIDLGDGSAEDIVLRFICEQNGLVILDYSTSLTDLDGNGRITVDGFLQNEEDRLDFNVDVQGTEQEGLETIDIQFSMGVESHGFEVTGAILGTEGAEETGEIDISVRHGDASLRVDVEESDGMMNGTISLNGEVFATVSGDSEDPSFTGASGEGLTASEIGVLLQIVGIVEEVFGLFEGLVAPIEGLVTLGIIL